MFVEIALVKIKLCIKDLCLRFIPTANTRLIVAGRGNLEVLAECLLDGIIGIILKCFPLITDEK